MIKYTSISYNLQNIWTVEREESETVIELENTTYTDKNLTQNTVLYKLINDYERNVCFGLHPILIKFDP